MAGKSYDAIVIGGGPAGYVAAIRLGQLGVPTLVVEREYVGGVCLNWGCIPSKALITAAAQWDRLHHSQMMGITVEGARFDFAKTQEWKEGIVRQLTGGVEGLIRGNGSDLVRGDARLVDSKTVEVTAADGRTERYAARKAVVIATGAAMVRVPGFDPDGERILTAREAVSLQAIPNDLVVIGGGVIGLELGMMYQRLGSRLTVVELSDGLLPGIDRDLVRVVEKRLEKRGARVLTGAKARGWEDRGGRVVVTVERNGRAEVIEADRVLVAAGFRPNTAGLGLEALGVRLDERGHVTTDRRGETPVPGVYAIGDVSGAPYLAHKAFKEAEVAAEVIAGKRVEKDWYALPAAIFTDPEIATVGVGEDEARRRGMEVKVGRFPFSVLGRAMSLNEGEGFVKVVSDENRVLGVSVVGPEASELIAEAALALEMVAAPEDVALTIHAHPTLGEAVNEAFKHALGEALHIRNRPARPAAKPALQAA
jgi:dihydrolipoamide dehydrogenase